MPLRKKRRIREETYPKEKQDRSSSWFRVYTKGCFHRVLDWLHPPQPVPCRDRREPRPPWGTFALIAVLLCSINKIKPQSNGATKQKPHFGQCNLRDPEIHSRDSHILWADGLLWWEEAGQWDNREMSTGALGGLHGELNEWWERRWGGCHRSPCCCK